MKTLSLFLVLFLFSNCVLLDITSKRELIQKKEISTREYETVEEEFLPDGNKKINQDSIILSVRKFKITKKIKETSFDSTYFVKEELSDSFYIVGGIIPFVVKDTDFLTYTAIAFFTFVYSFPVTIIDWASLPFRLRAYEEKKSESEKIVTNEARVEIKNTSDTQIKIHNKNFRYNKNELTIDFENLIGTWSIEDNFSKYFLHSYDLYKIINSNTLEKKIPLANLITTDEFYKILIADAKKRRSQHPLILSYFSSRVCDLRIDSVVNPSEIDKSIQKFKTDFTQMRKHCAFLILKSGSRTDLYSFSKLKEFINLKIEDNEELSTELNKPNHSFDRNKILLLASKKINYSLSFGDDYSVVQDLIHSGFDLNYRKDSSFSPLNSIVRTGNYELAKYLIENGADVNNAGEDNSANTPLYEAIVQNHLQLVKLLVEKGANVNHQNSLNISYLEFCETYNVDLEIREYLKSKGAK